MTSAWVGLSGVALAGILLFGCKAGGGTVAPSAEACVTPEPIECTVVESGAVEGESPSDEILTYQLQQLPNTPESVNDCQYCGVAILREADGRRELIGYARGEGANWYYTPRRIGSLGGPLIVVESRTQGPSQHNDDVVFQFGGDDRLSRVDVRLGRDDPLAFAPNATPTSTG